MTLIQYKVCPQCKRQSPLEAKFCNGCAHQFRTQFQQNPLPATEAQPSPQLKQSPPATSENRAVTTPDFDMPFVDKARIRGPFVFSGGETTTDLDSILSRAKTVRCLCPACGEEQRVPVPIDLSQLRCANCGSALDPMEWVGKIEITNDGPEIKGEGNPPINHLLMQRLIATCYLRPEFALSIINHYRRNFDCAVAQDWGIDKPLLLSHAANAVVQRGHRSAWPFALGCLLLLIPFFIPQPVASAILLVGVAIVAYLAAQNTRNRKHWQTYCQPHQFDPSAIPTENRDRVEHILHFCDSTQPRNVQFFVGYQPFNLTGQSDGDWSLLVDRRKRSDGSVEAQPADLDISSTVDNILHRLLSTTAAPTRFPNKSIKEQGLPMTRFRIDDVVLVSGKDVKSDDTRFIEDGKPKTWISPNGLDQVCQQQDSRYRAYKRIAYYDPQRDLGMLSFLRIAHQGPFTYIESAGTRLLPLVDRLMNQYSHELTANELFAESIGPEWWRHLKYEHRYHVKMVLSTIAGFLATCYLGSLILSPVLSDPNTGSDLPGITSRGASLLGVLFVLIIASITYGHLPKFDDDWEPKTPSVLSVLLTFGLALILPNSEEKERLRKRDRVTLAKKANEWDYSPKLNALRVWQSRSQARNFFENIDLTLLRRTNDLAIQEAFLECLEDADIDTSEFREGAARINNYGIINQGGNIQGQASVGNQFGEAPSQQQKIRNRAVGRSDQQQQKGKEK